MSAMFGMRESLPTELAPRTAPAGQEIATFAGEESHTQSPEFRSKPIQIMLSSAPGPSCIGLLGTHNTASHYPQLGQSKKVWLYMKNVIWRVDCKRMMMCWCSITEVVP